LHFLKITYLAGSAYHTPASAVEGLAATPNSQIIRNRRKSNSQIHASNPPLMSVMPRIGNIMERCTPRRWPHSQLLFDVECGIEGRHDILQPARSRRPETLVQTDYLIALQVPHEFCAARV
jgi:hypothetical protein